MEGDGGCGAAREAVEEAVPDGSVCPISQDEAGHSEAGVPGEDGGDVVHLASRVRMRLNSAAMLAAMSARAASISLVKVMVGCVQRRRILA